MDLGLKKWPRRGAAGDPARSSRIIGGKRPPDSG